MSGHSSSKRQRLEEGRQEDEPEEVDIRLSDELRGLLGGRKYAKTKDLTREILLEHAKRQGAVTEEDLLSVTVQTMGGIELEVTLEESKFEVKWLKLAIQDEQGISVFTQQLFLVSKGGDNNAAGASGGGAGAKQEPLKDEVLVSDSSIVAVCVDFSAALNEWDSSSPLIANKIFELSGEGNSIATKIGTIVFQDGADWNNCLWTNRVMESGKHRMSLKLFNKGEKGCMFGLVRDGAAWDNDHAVRASIDARYMYSDGGELWGNGKEATIDNDGAGIINEGQIVTMKADLDRGTLRPILG